ncbi:methyltransferase [Tardiphaga sp.]|uniref:methyltransferase n=1 Tax=Tardiphaga sp. TaxID=1926292 RepID=UPI0025F6E721|nr:methyltransferase [Tardiphaga sp.]
MSLATPRVAGETLTWRDRLFRLRDEILSNANFQRFAGGFALTRPIARKRAVALFDLCAGFVYSQVLLACVKLDLFEMLSRGPLGANELATRVSLPVASMRLLLDAATSLKLVQKRSGDRYGLGPLGAALLGNPGVLAMIRHHAMLYEDLTDPVALLRQERGAGYLARYWPYAANIAPAGLSSADVTPYTALMAQSQPMIAHEVLNACSFRDHHCLLDVGGGNGAFLSAVAHKYPKLKGVLFDLPAVAAQAAERFRAEGLACRATAIGGSFLSDALPKGADIVSLIRILHDHDDAPAMNLLRAVHRALPNGGTLVISEPLAGIRGAEPIADAYFAFYLLAMGSGRPRTFDRLRAMLMETGFAEVALKPAGMPMLTSVVTARKASKVDGADVNYT